MSTIYSSGMILRNASLEKALEGLQLVRSKCIQDAQKYTATCIASLLSLGKDLSENVCFLDEKSKNKHTFTGIMNDHYEAEMDVCGRGVRSTKWDATFSVFLIPCGKNLLARYDVENDLGYSDCLKTIGFEEYSWWNSSEKPDHIPDAEWDQREADWRSVTVSGSLAHAGFTYDLVGWSDLQKVLFSKDLVAANISTDDARRSRVAIRLSELEVAILYPKTENLMRLADEALKLAKERAPAIKLAEDPI